MTQRDHWEKIYAEKPTETLGWYKPHLQISLNWIRELCLAKDAPIIDVGGGKSTLVDDLLDEGYQTITVLDLSKRALASVQERLGKKKKLVTWIEDDITSIDILPGYYELWHDRAVFHFFIDPEQQKQYRNNLLRSLKPGGHLIMGTFAPEAPPQCSGLPVQRYNEVLLENTLGGEFKLMRHQKELHVTPSGVVQMYLYCHFRRSA